MCNIDIATGELVRYEVDLFLPGYIPLEITRSYASNADPNGLLGRGWSINLVLALKRVVVGYVLIDEDGAETALRPSERETGWQDASGTVTLEPREGYWLLDRGDGREYRFSEREYRNGLRMISMIRDRYGNRIAFDYDEQGNPRQITDSLVRQLRIECDGRGRITELRLAANFSTADSRLQMRYVYDGDGRLSSAINAIGGEIRYEYDAGLLVRETDRLGRKLRWQWDKQRRCIATWREGGILFRRLEFDDQRRTVLVTNALGQATYYALDENGNVTLEVNPLGDAVRNHFDLNGNLLAAEGSLESPAMSLFDEKKNCLSEFDANGAVSKYYFDNQDRLIHADLGDGHEWKQRYNEAGDIALLEGPGGCRWDAEYDPRGYLTKLTNSLGYFVAQARVENDRIIRWSDNLGDTTRSEYGPLGELLEITDPAGNATRCRSDALGRTVEIEAADGGVRRCQYDQESNIVALSDELGRTQRYEYDAADEVVRVVDVYGKALVIERDLESRMTALIDKAGNRMTFMYDAAGRVIHTEGHDGRSITVSYDPLTGEPRRTTDHDGSWVDVEGPSLAPESRTYPDGTQCLLSFATGHLVSAAGPGGSVLRELDARSRVVKENQDGWEIAFEYDCCDNLTRVAEPEGGRATEYEYDCRKRVTRIRDSHFGDFACSYNDRDLLLRLDYPQGWSLRFDYDRCDRMKEAALHDASGGQVLRRVFGYDQADQLIFESMGPAFDLAAYDRRYEYDSLGRLARVESNGTTTEWYEYDATGNVRSCQLYPDSDLLPGNRLTRAGGVRYEYDRRGNRVKTAAADGETHYEYDWENRLQQATLPDGTQSRFRYDPMGRRLEKQRGEQNTLFRWAGDTLFKEESADGENHYLYLPTSFFPIAISRGGEKAIVVLDQIASPRELVGWDGTLLWSRSASSFGADQNSGAAPRPWTNCPLRFQGQYHDPELQLSYNYQRYYDPFCARFLTQDPHSIHGSLNVYEYVLEPLTWIDPYGQFSITLVPRCDWNKAQMAAFQKKVDRYNAAIQTAKAKGKPGLVISKCARKSQNLQDEYKKKCKEKNGKAKKGSPNGKGKKQDCQDDIDHAVDKQMGGKDECSNYYPVNASVNRSLGSQMKKALKGKNGQALTRVVAGDKSHCPDKSPRTPKCK